MLLFEVALPSSLLMIVAVELTLIPRTHLQELGLDGALMIEKS